MSDTKLSDVANQVKKYWGAMFMDELKEDTLLPSLVNKDYQGDIKNGGDTVYVSQINRPNAERKTVGSGAESFSSQLMSTSRVAIQANQRITASFEMEDLVQLQSQIGENDSTIRQALLDSVEIELNNYLYSLVSPSTSSPDHVLNGITDMNKAQVIALRNLASTAKWKRDDWWLLLDPTYMGEILADTTLTSSDYVGGDAPIVAGQVASKRLGFNILEDNSAGILQLSPANIGVSCGLGFHKDFLHLVMQRQPTFQLSSLHANNKHGFLLSVDILVAGLGVDGSSKHIQIYDT